MKNILVFVVLLFTILPAGIAAQEEPACDAAGINAQVSALIATYLTAQADATDSETATQAAEDLQTGITEVLATCAEAPAETEEPAEAPAEGIGMITEGEWALTWDAESISCPGDNYTADLIDYHVMIQVDPENNIIIWDDVFRRGHIEFALDSDGVYSVIVTRTDSDGYSYTRHYRITEFTANTMVGFTTDYFPGSACVSLEYGNHMTLVDGNVICMVGAESGGNIRSGPGSNYDRLGAFEADRLYAVIGQTTTSDGFVWWQLAEGGWTRSDIVTETGHCEDVPVVTP